MAVRTVPVRLDLAAISRVADRVEYPRLKLRHRRPLFGRSMPNAVWTRLATGVPEPAARAPRIPGLTSAAHDFTTAISLAQQSKLPYFSSSNLTLMASPDAYM